MSTYPVRTFLFVATLATALLLNGCGLFKDKAIKQIDVFIAEQSVDKTKEDWKTTLNTPPQLDFDEGNKYVWQLTTNKGLITLDLMPDIAPMHVSSTIYLTKLGFYDNTSFHRVITGFMAQGGDPLGNGAGNPGYKYAGEFSDDVKHTTPGLLSMANAGPGTDGSQFFLTFAPTPWLDGKHTIFGQVVEGMEVLKTMEDLGSRSGRTKEDLLLIKAEILVK